jgi:hypothetical protein
MTTQKQGRFHVIEPHPLGIVDAIVDCDIVSETDSHYRIRYLHPHTGCITEACVPKSDVFDVIS